MGNAALPIRVRFIPRTSFSDLIGAGDSAFEGLDTDTRGLGGENSFGCDELVIGLLLSSNSVKSVSVLSTHSPT